MPGNTIVSDVEHMIRLCSRVIVVCSENYHGASKDEVSSTGINYCGVEINCCKEMATSRRGCLIPIILDGVEDTDFAEFTQHRIKSDELIENLGVREDFLKRLKRDMNITRINV